MKILSDSPSLSLSEVKNDKNEVLLLNGGFNLL